MRRWSAVAQVRAARPGPSLYTSAPWLPAQDLSAQAVEDLFGTARRHEEHEGATLLSFFHGARSHVVLRAKELLRVGDDVARR